MIMGSIGTGELIVALLLVALLFGAKRLPEVARGLGQSLRVFRVEVSRPSADTGTAETTPHTDSTERTAQ